MPTETPATPWSRQEFLAYLLLYAAHIDINFAENERAYILSKVAPDTYQKVLAEFSEDNDYQQVQKILAFQDRDKAFSEERLLNEIKELFQVDDEFHPMEQGLLLTFKRLFR